MRENTERMRLPRFLWVPFPLGRPFGAPHEPEFQRRVLRTALSLLERSDGPIVLEDFPDDAPEAVTDDSASWACPVSFEPPAGSETELVRDTLDEMARLAPWHQLFVEQGGRAAPRASELPPEDLVRGLGALSEGQEVTGHETALPLIEWVRLGCDDLRTWYAEAAQGQPGRASAAELDHWFWEQTAFARLIAAAALRFAHSEDGGHRIFGRRSMVPRAHMRTLMPGVDSSTGELPGFERSPS